MKLLYLVGLEHSGTTLVSHLLGQHEAFLALGEIAAFFSSSHMQQYMDTWGDHEDVSLCSCGEDWQDCEFWGDLIGLAGHHSESGLLSKYKRLFEYFNNRLSPQRVIIDSSKSFSTLVLLLENAHYFGISKQDVGVVFAVKDVRNFATSIAVKPGAKHSFISHYRSFNWWLGENKKVLNYLEQAGVDFQLHLYDSWVANKDRSLSSYFSAMGYPDVESSDVSHSKSHIAMGNKNFIMRNRAEISYDDRWKRNLRARLAYLLHPRARAFNKFLYRYAGKHPHSTR